MANYTLLTPGPVPCPDAVLKALSLPILHHRVPEFEAILDRVLVRMRHVFGTQQAVMIHTATGSGAMESAIVNTLSPGDEILCVISGKFGERWAEMAKVYGVKTHDMTLPWGEKLDLAEFEKQLKAHPNVKAVLTQVCETSTATLHPIKEMAALTRKHTQALFIADAITAIGAIPYQMDEWGIDVTVAGSQKAFMIPTGLSFVSFSERAWQAYKSSKLPKYYFDLGAEFKSNKKKQTYFSSSVSLIRGLDVALNEFEGAKLGQRVDRSQRLMKATHAAAKELGLSLFSKSPSPSVTAIALPAGCDGQQLRDLLETKYHVTVMGGQDQLTGKILRVGHLGYIRNNDMVTLFKALAAALREVKAAVSGPQEEKALAQLQLLLGSDV